MPSDSIDLESLGAQYYEKRKEVMLTRNFGLTDTYNLINDSNVLEEDIQSIRLLHVKLDKAVSFAYGWYDLDLSHGFYDTKQGIRFTISEVARREVLQRLLKLNHERYEEEVAQGLHGKKKTSAPRKKEDSTAKDNGNLDLFNFTNVSSKGLK